MKLNSHWLAVALVGVSLTLGACNPNDPPPLVPDVSGLATDVRGGSKISKCVGDDQKSAEVDAWAWNTSSKNGDDATIQISWGRSDTSTSPKENLLDLPGSVKDNPKHKVLKHRSKPAKHEDPTKYDPEHQLASSVEVTFTIPGNTAEVTVVVNDYGQPTFGKRFDAYNETVKNTCREGKGPVAATTTTNASSGNQNGDNDSWTGTTGRISVTITRDGCAGYKVAIKSNDGDNHHWQIGVDQNDNWKEGNFGARGSTTETAPKGPGGTTRISVKADKKSAFIKEIKNC